MLLVLIGVAAACYLPDILFAPPFGLHFTRQTDSLAFAEHYHLFGNGPLHPAVFDLRTAPDGGRAVAEFPLLYWWASLFFSGPGPHVVLLRLLHLSFVLAGHFAWARALGRLFGDRLVGLLLSLWALGSGVVLFYACNFLPDAAAYGLVLIGWSFIVDGLAGHRTKWVLPAAVAFGCAALLKAPLGMHLLVLALLAARWPGPEGASRPSWRSAVVPLAGLLPALAWHAYAIIADAAHGTHYFMVSAAPLWDMDRAAVRTAVDHILQYWWTAYRHPSSWHVVLALWPFALWPFSRTERAFTLPAWCLLLSGAGFTVLFFAKFKDHDYYFLNLAPGVMLLAVLGLYRLQRWWPRVFRKEVLLLGTGVLAIVSLQYAYVHLQRRWTMPADDFSRTGELLADLPAALDTLDVPLDARVIVLGDSTPNGALSIMGRMGWSFPGPADRETITPEQVRAEADLVLCIAPAPLPAWPLRPLSRTAGWSLWELVHHDARP